MADLIKFQRFVWIKPRNDGFMRVRLEVVVVVVAARVKIDTIYLRRGGAKLAIFYGAHVRHESNLSLVSYSIFSIYLT